MTEETRGVFAALESYTDRLIYPQKQTTQPSEAPPRVSTPLVAGSGVAASQASIPNSAPTPRSPSTTAWIKQKIAQGFPRDIGTAPASLFTLSGAKRAASPEPPTPPKKARLDVGERGKPDEAALGLTLVQLEKLIEMSKIWQEQHKLLSLFLSCSSPARATPSASTPSLPSPKLQPERHFPSDGTIPCTYPSEGLSSSPLPRDPASRRQPAPSTFTWSDTTIAPPSPVHRATPLDLSSSISEPASEKPSTLRVYVKGTSLTPPPGQGTSRARELYRAFQTAKESPSTVKEVRAEIRKQARDADVYLEFQALLSQPRLPFTPIPANRG